MGDRRDIRTLADEELMPLATAGDTRAFETLYERHAHAAFSLAHRIVGNRALAEDATQEAFVTLWRSRHAYTSARGAVRSWLLSIVHSRTVDGLRRESVHERRRASDTGLEERAWARERTDEDVERRDLARSVREAIAALPRRQGQVVALAYFGGLTISEIAAALEAPLGTVKGRMRLGQDKLRRQLSAA